MPMFAAPFNLQDVTFFYEFHASHSLPNVWYLYRLIVIQLILVESIKTTYMEDVSRRVLEKIKNI